VQNEKVFYHIGVRRHPEELVSPYTCTHKYMSVVMCTLQVCKWGFYKVTKINVLTYLF